MPLPVEFKLGVVSGLWGWPPELVPGSEVDILTETRADEATNSWTTKSANSSRNWSCCKYAPGGGGQYSSSSRDEDGWNLSATDAKSAVNVRNAC